MDLVERNLERSESPPNLLQDFRKTREADYRLFLVRESMVGENVCAETLAAVTQREVDAGRMSPDHTLYTMAHEQVAKPHLSRAELVAITAKKRGQLRRGLKAAGVALWIGCDDHGPTAGYVDFRWRRDR